MKIELDTEGVDRKHLRETAKEIGVELVEPIEVSLSDFCENIDRYVKDHDTKIPIILTIDSLSALGEKQT